MKHLLRAECCNPGFSKAHIACWRTRVRRKERYIVVPQLVTKLKNLLLFCFSSTFSKAHIQCLAEIKAGSFRLGSMHPFRPYGFRSVACIIIILFACNTVGAQQITGVWEGRIEGRKTELKLVQKGDSLTGTAYYYQSAQRYRQYSIKGYFDARDNSVVWWDDVLLADKGNTLLRSAADPLLSVADFNCPGGGRMLLDGSATKKEDPDAPKKSLALQKIETPLFPDVWDYVIANYTLGTNDPELIDSIAQVAYTPPQSLPVAAPEPKAEPVQKPVLQPMAPQQPVATAPLTIEEKFKTREKVFTTEIPVVGDSIELRFYDNAQVDGDSISLFLNNEMLFQHIRLTEKAYTIKLPTTAFADTAELVMVAENLGSIPPNTSYMVAISGGRRYEARLASTENSSAYIRLRKGLR